MSGPGRSVSGLEGDRLETSISFPQSRGVWGWMTCGTWAKEDVEGIWVVVHRC